MTSSVVKLIYPGFRPPACWVNLDGISSTQQCFDFSDYKMVFDHCSCFCAETTVDPDTCACDVSKAEVTDLKTRLEKVEKLLAGSDIGSLESTVNDVLNGVTTMQQCISKMVLPGTEE